MFRAVVLTTLGARRTAAHPIFDHPRQPATALPSMDFAQAVSTLATTQCSRFELRLRRSPRIDHLIGIVKNAPGRFEAQLRSFIDEMYGNSPSRPAAPGEELPDNIGAPSSRLRAESPRKAIVDPMSGQEFTADRGRSSGVHEGQDISRPSPARQAVVPGTVWGEDADSAITQGHRRRQTRDADGTSNRAGPLTCSAVRARSHAKTHGQSGCL